MSSLDTSSSIRTKVGKLESRAPSKADRDSAQDYKLHCVPKLHKKINQPKPLPKPVLDEVKDSSSSQHFPPQTPQKSAEKKFKKTLEGFEKQAKLREATITGSLEQKLSLASIVGKETSKPTHPTTTIGESEGLLSLYEEAPIEGDHLEELTLDHFDNSRANLVRLCKIAYERGRKDGISDDRKKVKEEGYCRGFKEGHKEGREEGCKEGYREGYDEGYMKGREYGDKKIEKEINETIAELTKNPSVFLMSTPKVSPHSESIGKPAFNMI